VTSFQKSLAIQNEGIGKIDFDIRDDCPNIIAA
jgi:hypothetical protein